MVTHPVGPVALVALLSVLVQRVDGVIPLSVATSSGTVVGLRNGTLTQWRGIRFAQAPVGALRWRSPVPHYSNATVSATGFGPACLQQDTSQPGLVLKGSEDCLFVNVWRPTEQVELRQGPLPVLVWIYGGSFLHGSSSNPEYDLSNLVALQHNVIGVSLNYRLGPLGFLQHPKVSAYNKGHSGMLGIEDQRMALTWVQNNIAAFGGDPTRVTIMGQSAGGISVCFHIVSPLSAGLFHQAISQSGPCDTTNAADVAIHAGELFFEQANCSTVSCLLQKNSTQLMEYAQGMGGLTGFSPTQFGPSVDGYVLPTLPSKLLRTGQFNRVPYLLGSDRDEMTVFMVLVDAWRTVNQSTFAGLADKYGLGNHKVLQFFTPQRYASSAPYQYQTAFSRLISDRVFICGQRRMARYLSAGGHGGAPMPVYYYSWNHVPDHCTLTAEYPWIGAYHFSEVPFVMGNMAADSGIPSLSAREYNMSSYLQHYWIRFVVSGSPNSQDDFGPFNPGYWPRYTIDADVNLNLDFANNGTFLTQTSRYQAECDVWDFAVDEVFHTGDPTPTPAPTTTNNSHAAVAIAAIVLAVVALVVVVAVQMWRRKEHTQRMRQGSAASAYTEL